MIKANALFPVVKECRTSENAGFDILTGSEQNLVIEFCDKETAVFKEWEDLAVKMVEMDSILRDILREFKTMYAGKQDKFYISLRGRTSEEIEKLNQLFSEMEGFIKNYYICSECKTFVGELYLYSSAIKFISGGYMEIAIHKIIKDIIKNLSVKYGKTFRVYRNVRVNTKKGIIRNEFDLIIENVDDSVIYIVEVKSGAAQKICEKFNDTKKKYPILPERFLLVSNHIPDHIGNIIERSCHCYVANLRQVEEKVIAMISNDMSEQYC